MAMDRVQDRLLRVSAALDAAGIPYAVVGGNAVAAWVAKANPAATRTTKDVDILVARADLGRVTAVMQQLGFKREILRSLVVFLDPAEPDRRSGVHLVWASEKVRPSNLHPAPDVRESIRDVEYQVLDLSALVRMKLTSFRDIDRVHVADLLSVGLIDDRIRNSLPSDLQIRLDEIEQSRDTELDE